MMSHLNGLYTTLSAGRMRFVVPATSSGISPSIFVSASGLCLASCKNPSIPSLSFRLTHKLTVNLASLELVNHDLKCVTADPGPAPLFVFLRKASICPPPTRTTTSLRIVTPQTPDINHVRAKAFRNLVGVYPPSNPTTTDSRNQTNQEGRPSPRQRHRPQLLCDAASQWTRLS